MNKVAIIGEVNVGKSTLFNRLIEKEKAVTSKIPGTTRDRNYGPLRWRGKEFILIDTGGLQKLKISARGGSRLGSGKNEKVKINLETEVQKHIYKAIEEADLILFILDIRREITSHELNLVRLVKSFRKPAILVANKADSPSWRARAKDLSYLKLGLGRPLPISAATGGGVGDLLDEVVKLTSSISPLKRGRIKVSNRGRVAVDSISPLKRERIKEGVIKVAIIGKPNVGKSSLLNALLGEEKVIVSPVPQTTRAPQDSLLFFQGRPLLLIDTAGIRRKGKIKEEIEKAGVAKSLRVIERADIVLVVIDVADRVSHQDKALINLALKNKKGLILVVNKIDQIPDFRPEHSRKLECSAEHKRDFVLRFKVSDFIKYYQNTLAMASFAPIVFVSAKTGQNVQKIFDLVLEVDERSMKKIDPQTLEKILKEIIKEKNFNSKIWSKVKLIQTGTYPPKFILKVPKPVIRRRLIHQAQINIIKKELRKKCALFGTPIEINIKT